MLTITKEQFLAIYKGTRVTEYIDLFYSDPTSDFDLLTNYLPSKLWRLNNCYTIVNKFGKRIRFRMNMAQHKVYAASLRHPRIVILKSRQQGISTFWLVSFFDDGICNKDFSIGLMAQGVDEATTLLERTKILWEELDPSIKNYLNRSVTTDNTKEFSLNNGSKVFVRTSFRSGTLQRLHISEMGKIANNSPDKAEETKSGTLQTIAPGNIAVIESTAEGDNMFKEMWDNAMQIIGERSLQDFLPVFLSWLDDPDCVDNVDQVISDAHAKYFTELEAEIGYSLTRQQKNFWITKKRELDEKMFAEYPATAKEAFTKMKNGTYYAGLFMIWVVANERIKENLYDRNLPVQIAADLGMNDTMSITVFQVWQGEMRIIDEIYDSGYKISHYTDIIKKREWFPNLRNVILPHDANVTDLTSGQTRKQAFEDELPGINIPDPLERTNVNDGIESVRTQIMNLWIVPKCTYLLGCFYNYRKEWDDKRKVWRSQPEHNEHSNGADSIRYAVIGADHNLKLEAPPRRRVRGMDI